MAQCTQKGNQLPGCTVVVVANGKKVREVEGAGTALPALANSSGRLGSSVMGLVEVAAASGSFRGGVRGGEPREKWQQKRDATDSFDFQRGVGVGAGGGAGEGNAKARGARLLTPPESNSPPREDGNSALQLARMAYRAVNPHPPKMVHGEEMLALPLPSVTRSSRMSGKFTATGMGIKPPVPRSGRLDPKEREQKEVEASRSIRRSMGKNPSPIIKIQKSNFTIYSLGELQAAMDVFWPNHILGEGSYGIVYRGMLNGFEVAIKQLKNPDARSAMEEIDREIEVQKRCDHQNLVKLLGYSVEDRSLVYEYLSQGSLEDRLLCMGGSPPLLWPDRCRIAMEVAAALQHLHTRTPPIVHRDVKPANVLLDEHFVAKLGDVGLARLMEDMANGNTHIVRKSVIVGTEHYVDPEYLCARRGYLGPKSDVYSFGIVLLQVLVGGIPNLRKIDMAVEREELEGFLDPKAGRWPMALAMDMANLGLWCSEMDRKDRPDLEEEVIPALLEICEAAALEVVASEQRSESLKEEEEKQKEAARILEEEKAVAYHKAQAEAVAAKAVPVLPPAHQKMSKVGQTSESTHPVVEKRRWGCCWAPRYGFGYG